MAHKFFYNGKLIRKSEHEYTHAVITDDGKLAGCRTSRDAAQSIISSEISHAQREIENHKRALKALENGENGYVINLGRGNKYFHKFGNNEYETVENCQAAIRRLESFIEKCNNWKVVELEKRD